VAGEPLVLTPGRAETRFGDDERVVFKVAKDGLGNHPCLVWTVRLAEGGNPSAAGVIVDPNAEKGVFVPFPVDKPLTCVIRATLAGTGRYGEATLVVRPPKGNRGRRVRVLALAPVAG
jgi:hypothetical protein